MKKILSKTLGLVLSLTMGVSMLACGTFAASASSGNLISNGGFEDGTTTGWTGRGGVETLSATKDAARTGSYGMFVSGRTKNWHGASYNLFGTLKSGGTYDITAYVKAVPGQSSHTEQASLSIQRTDGDGTHYDNIQYNSSISENSWTKLSGRYTLSYSGTLTDLSLYIESPDDTLEYYVDDVEADEVSLNPQKDLVSIADYYKGDFNVGVAVDPVTQINADDPHQTLIARHFNSLTAGNCMKPETVEPTENTFNFTPADKLCDYAIAHHMRMRGHTLLWHNQMPGWFFQDPNDSSKECSRDVLLARLKTYITTVLTHFKTKYGDNNPVYCWDVVNEVISDSHQNDGLRGTSENSKWLSIIGPDYIEKAFTYAHAADPSVKLYINDYNIEDNGQKTTDMYNEVKSLLAKNVPVDGIGLQMHIQNDFPSAADVKASIEKFASLGVSLQVTELDCLTNKDTSAAALAEQASRYKDMFNIFLSEKKYINSVTFWGVSDETSWRGADNAPLLFDQNLQAKPAYYSIVSTKPAVISPDTASFDKNTAKAADIPVTVTYAAALSGISNGTTALVKDTDYTVAADGTVTISKSYLASLPTGTATLTFTFSDGSTAVLTVTVTDSSSGTVISPETASFDKNTAKQADIPVTVTSAATLSGISNGTAALVKDTDYTVAADGTVTISKSYLASLPTGTAKLTFTFSDGSTAVLTITVTDSTAPAGGSLQIEEFNASTQASSNSIMPRLKIVNTGNTPVDLSTVKIRYYFTADGTQPQNFWCDWSSAGQSNITGTFVKMPAAVSGADTYLELGFTSGAGTLAPGEGIEVQARFAKNDWSNYNQADDYSFNSASNSYTPWSKVTAYIGDLLAFGAEPQ